MLCIVLCFVGDTFNFECLLNTARVTRNMDYNELQKLDKVAAGNGLNKWILCNLCHFSVIQKPAVTNTRILCGHRKSAFHVFVKYYSWKWRWANQSYCRSNDDGTSQINVQTHSNAEKFKIIILSACKTHLLFFFLILCELGPAARNFFPFWWSFTVVLFCFLSVGRWKKNFTRNFDCLRIKLQYFFLLGFGHIDHFSFQKERE